MFHVLSYVRPFAFPRWAIRAIRVIRTFRTFRTFRIFRIFRFFQAFRGHPGSSGSSGSSGPCYGLLYGMKKGAEAYSLVIPRHRGDSHLYTSTPSIVPRVGLEPTRPFRARRF